jgi:hypothetical protein
MSDDQDPIDDKPFLVTFFPTQQARSKSERTITLEELAELIRQTHAPTKADLPWFKLGFFGDKRTDKNCLRSNSNLRWVSGIEADYDQEQIGFDHAVNILDKAAVRSLIYTSASHTRTKPRWRVLAPFDLGRQPDQRNKYLARLSGLFGSVFSGESWTLSQAFYYGRVDTPKEPGGAVEAIRVVVIEGDSIDLRNDLDAGTIGKATTRTPGSVGTVAGDDAAADAELIRQILAGEVLHPPLCAMAARLIGRGLYPAAVAEQLRGYMLVTPEASRDERWHQRYGEIPALVDSAGPKFTPEPDKKDAWKAVARITHRMIKERRLVEDIIWTVTEVAKERGIDVGRALTLADKICAEAAEAGNV